MTRPVTMRLFLVVVAAELPFLPLAIAAFVWSQGLFEVGALRPTLVLIACIYLTKTALLAVSFLRLLAPTERALAAGANASKEEIVVGVEAARRITLVAPILGALGWGFSFLIPTLALALNLGNRPYADEGLVSALLFCSSIAIGVFPATYGITLLALRAAIFRLSLAARNAGAADPPSRGVSLRTRFLLLSLTLTIGPSIWIMSMAYSPGIRGTEHVFAITFLYCLVAVLWAIITAISISAAIGGSIAHITEVVEEIATTGGSTTSRVPALQTDELGRLAQALNQTADHLADLDRAKQQFLSNAAHELKTPVTLVKGYAQLLRSTAGDPKRLNSALEAIERGAGRMDRIICDCLDFANFQLGRVPVRAETFDLGPKISEVVGDEETKRRRVIRVVGPVPVACIHADPVRIEHVFRCLIDNAVQNSPDREPVDVSIETGVEDVRVAVVDRGPGIPASCQSQVLEPFGWAMGEAHTGSGLYTSCELIRQSGGEMGFSTAEGRGSTFWFRLPSAVAEE